jgi:hypothetical protein
MNWRRVAFWFGVIALLDAVLLVLPVNLPGAGLVEVVPRAVVPLLALVGAGYGVKVLAAATGDVPVRERPVTEREESADVDRVGEEIDDAFDALRSDDATAWSQLNAARVLRAELRRSTTTALESRGHPPEAARRLVESGEWTDDRRAGAFLGEVHMPLWMRVRDWASGEGTRRQAGAAVEELHRLTESGGSGGAGGPRPDRRDRRPAGEVLGDALGSGGATRTERTAEIGTEVDA